MESVSEQSPVIIWKGNSCFVNGKKVGEIINDGKVYFTPRDANKHGKHFYRNRNGYPIDVPIIDELMKRKVEVVTIQTYNIPENTKDKIPVEKRNFSVAEYNLSQKFRNPGYGWQKCVDWDRPLPEAEVQSTLFSLIDFYKN